MRAIIHTARGREVAGSRADLVLIGRRGAGGMLIRLVTGGSGAEASTILVWARVAIQRWVEDRGEEPVEDWELEEVADLALEMARNGKL